MWLQIHISRSTVSVSASRGTPPSTLSVKGQIETVRVKGTVDNSARLQWLASDSGVVFSFFNREPREPRRQSFCGRLQSRKQQMEPSVRVIYPCLVCFYTQSWTRFCSRAAKNRCSKLCMLLGWSRLWLMVVLIVTLVFFVFLSVFTGTENWICS